MIAPGLSSVPTAVLAVADGLTTICLRASEPPYCPHGFCQGKLTLWQTLKTAGLWLARLCASFLVLSSLINLVYYY